MPPQSGRQYKSYMKPVAKRVTIQRPQAKRDAAPLDSLDMLPNGFTRISEVKIRKVYGQFAISACLAPAKPPMVAGMGDTNPKNNQKKKAQASAKKAGNQKKPAVSSAPAGKKK